MQLARVVPLAAALAVGAACFGQVANQVQLKIDPSSRTISVSAEGRVAEAPDLAILHIGFITPPSDAKQAYAAGSTASNQIVNALKQAGLADSAIHSQSQQLESWDPKARKYQLEQSWTVRVAPPRVAEILDVAVNAGATESGNIEWTVADERALQEKALAKAADRARADAQVLAKGMGVQLGKLVYATNQLTEPIRPISHGIANFVAGTQAATQPLAIEPNEVSSTATVYAVFAIE